MNQFWSCVIEPLTPRWAAHFEDFLEVVRRDGSKCPSLAVTLLRVVRTRCIQPKRVNHKQIGLRTGKKNPGFFW